MGAVTLALVSFAMNTSYLLAQDVPSSSCTFPVSVHLSKKSLYLLVKNGDSKPRYGRPRILNWVIGGLLTKEMAAKWSREVVGHVGIWRKSTAGRGKGLCKCCEVGLSLAYG